MSTAQELEGERAGRARPAWRPRVPGWRRLPRWGRRALSALAALAVAVTVASFSYNLATGAPAPRPAGLRFAAGGGFTTRYLQWGASGTPVVLLPGALETADTFAALGPVLAAARHRVYAIDLTGTGYSAPSPPYTAGHLAAQVVAFLKAKGLTGPDAPVLVGHSAGAADAGVAALAGPGTVRAVVFLDGDALPLGGPRFLGYLLVDPFRTSLLRLALSSGGLIRSLYDSQCGPSCPPLSAAGVSTWRWPLEQPGFEGQLTDQARAGITAMTSAQFAALAASKVAKLVVVGSGDPQMSHADAAATARAIGAPPPVYVPGRHLTMIAAPRQVAAAIAAVATASGPLPR
ncbi:MAG TPA: alpha/beta hydrolase [Trebonia sp.]|nr:alpha/beta hydrolase [Trebonia sp.]